MGCITEIIELQGKVERKDAHIDQLTNQLAEITKDRDERAELSARLFTENQQLKQQLNDKKLEIDHCHAVCDELRREITGLKNQRATVVASALDIEADLIMSAPDLDNNWTEEEARIAKRIGSMLKARAALVRAKAGA